MASMKKSEAPQDIYQLKVTLAGFKPPIWRRILVPAGMSLEQLHMVIQRVMGWQNSHLHEFSSGELRFGQPDPMDTFMGGPAVQSERRTLLFQVIGSKGAKLNYTYDFGDGWEHGIKVEKILAPDPAFAYPACTAGAGRCPPEDCGGLPGYYDLLETLGDPKHPEHGEMLEWVGGAFDPNYFSAAEADGELKSMRRRQRGSA